MFKKIISALMSSAYAHGGGTSGGSGGKATGTGKSGSKISGGKATSTRKPAIISGGKAGK